MQNRLVLAMAHQRLGHERRARVLPEEAPRWWKRVEAARAGGTVPFSNTDWLAPQPLRREAEALILYDTAFSGVPFAP
jgi:hypothetical protein